MERAIYVGIDLGGTAIKAGICDADGRLIHTAECPTPVKEGAEAVVQRIAELARQLVEASPYHWDQVAGVGAGIPGFLDMEEGHVKHSVNLGWEDVPVKQWLEANLGKSVKIDNDANAAALGEAWGGAGAGIPNVVCYTLGTGVGGGIIVKRRLIQGFSGMAGEIGHIPVVPDDHAIRCGCGKYGCLETVSSATGMVHMAEAALKVGLSSSLSVLANITAKDVVEHAVAGDPIALNIVSIAAGYIGKSMAILSVVVNPQRFIIGGGVAQAGEFLLNLIDRHYRENALHTAQDGVEIVPASLGNNAGVVGAAGLHLFG
ncbi:ROK family glucokinase [Cohnella fermenti]|uniref:Glucokinase n=1 Tax=Cohnella fermenti TaxID=2565925 RepID=A0A4S4BL02_9BACL|nr:ROK family glucokinase [Cohnella fermenti]THF75227.1 ROK family glucokinase [Cohnella fermenti]